MSIVSTEVYWLNHHYGVKILFFFISFYFTVWICKSCTSIIGIITYFYSLWSWQHKVEKNVQTFEMPVIFVISALSRFDSTNLIWLRLRNTPNIPLKYRKNTCTIRTVKQKFSCRLRNTVCMTINAILTT